MPKGRQRKKSKKVKRHNYNEMIEDSKNIGDKNNISETSIVLKQKTLKKIINIIIRQIEINKIMICLILILIMTKHICLLIN